MKRRDIWSTRARSGNRGITTLARRSPSTTLSHGESNIDRAEYDAMLTARKIIEVGLPEVLGLRLFRGS